MLNLLGPVENESFNSFVFCGVTAVITSGSFLNVNSKTTFFHGLYKKKEYWKI